MHFDDSYDDFMSGFGRGPSSEFSYNEQRRRAGRPRERPTSPRPRSYGDYSSQREYYYHDSTPSPIPSFHCYSDSRRRTYSPPPGPPLAYAYTDQSRRTYSPRPKSPPPRFSRRKGPSPRPSPRPSFTAPPSHESKVPVPYTYEDEEPDSIPIAPADWNNYTSYATREQLVSFFVKKGIHRAIAETEVGKEFAAHAPQRRSGQTAPGASRFEEACRGRARAPSPQRSKRYRSSSRDRSHPSRTPPGAYSRSR